MASTGVYWLPLLHMLEARGCAVALVKARHVKHVPGRPKTDRCDGRWRQKLHTYGVLAPSLRPPEDMCRLRRLLRHRDHLIQMPVKPMQHMPKALEHMPLHLHHVMRDVTGVTGRRLIRAMVAGERAPKRWATSRDSRIQATQDPMTTALEGDDRPAQVFTLTQSLALSDCTQQHIADCEQDIERGLSICDALVDPAEHPFPPPTTAQRRPQRNAPACDLRTHLSRIPGVDLTHVPG